MPPSTLIARKAKLLDSLLIQAFASETKAGELHEQFRSIKEMLVPDMSEAAFADMYAQTIAYGLFAARIFDPTPGNFTRMEAASLLPPTNPPYSGHSANKGEWIGRMMRDYYQVDGQPLGQKTPNGCRRIM